MISSGGTLLDTVEMLIEMGAAEIIICATQASFVKEYQENLQKVLTYDQVKVVAVTNCLPLRNKDGEDLAIPSITVGDQERRVEVLDIAPYLAQVILALLTSDTLEEALSKPIIVDATSEPDGEGTVDLQLRDIVLPLSNPYRLFKEITGKDYPEPVDVGLYENGKSFESVVE